jgi:phosphohistidine phosphatase SixA
VRRVAIVLALLSVAAAGCGEKPEPEPDAPASEPASAEDRALVRQLREGGLVIAFRHAATDQSAYDSEAGDYADCGRQRNLDLKGRRQSRAIGAAFRGLGIPVGDVRSSPYCRARDTAQLAFGRARLDRRLLEPMRAGEDPGDLVMAATFRRRLEARPRPGTNTVIVTHNFPPRPGQATLAEGEAALFRSADGRLELIARVAPAHWPRLARALGQRTGSE